MMFSLEQLCFVPAHPVKRETWINLTTASQFWPGFSFISHQHFIKFCILLAHADYVEWLTLATARAGTGYHCSRPFYSALNLNYLFYHYSILLAMLRDVQWSIMWGADSPVLWGNYCLQDRAQNKPRRTQSRKETDNFTKYNLKCYIYHQCLWWLAISVLVVPKTETNYNIIFISFYWQRTEKVFSLLTCGHWLSKLYIYIHS